MVGMISRMILLSLSLVLSAVAFATPAQRAVLVTGATSGIGLRTAEHLSASGFYVYAGARKQADMDRLNAMKNVEAVKLDVTSLEDITAAVEQITKGGKGLYGIVNNAGVVIFQPLIEVSQDQMDFIFDVNVYGPYRITKAFAPLLIESKGRVVNISSISGFLSGPLFGPYSMTKHALEAYNDSLALELARFGVKVAAIEPGNFDSKIGDSAIRRMRDRGASFETSPYKDDIEQMIGWMNGVEEGADPIAVGVAVEQALVSAQPKARYLVVPNQREADITLRKAIREMLELNHEQDYSYDEAAVLKMVQEQYQAMQSAPN